MVKVADGYDVDTVLGNIKLKVRGVSAVAARTMTSDVADSVSGVAGVIQVVFGAIGVLALVVLVVAFLVVGRHRTREFAVLRVLGASKKALSGIVLKEGCDVSAAGASWASWLRWSSCLGLTAHSKARWGCHSCYPRFPRWGCWRY